MVLPSSRVNTEIAETGNVLNRHATSWGQFQELLQDVCQCFVGLGIIAENNFRITTPLVADSGTATRCVRVLLVLKYVQKPP